MKKTLIIISVLSLLTLIILLFYLNKGDVQEDPEIPEEISQEETVDEFIFGIYEVCSDLEFCDIKEGIKKIKETGLKSVIVTVIDEEEGESYAYYPSEYLPMPEYIKPSYIPEIVKEAQDNGIKVYASINLPHNYWLKGHPDWITVWSNGKPGDYYEDDYFHRTVPASRIISEEECQDLLESIVKEVEALGFDGIDINDNFAFPDQYLEDKDLTIFSSYDEFTVNKFKQETGADLSDQEAWHKWRSEQVTGLIKLFDEIISLPFRPHLLTHENPYEYYGLDYKEIEKYVDVMYFMIMPDQDKEKYFKTAEGIEKKIAVSTYFLSEETLTLEQRVQTIKDMGASEIYFYDFKYIDENSLWDKLF